MNQILIQLTTAELTWTFTDIKNPVYKIFKLANCMNVIVSLNKYVYIPVAPIVSFGMSLPAGQSINSDEQLLIASTTI